jgi:hypothetical protein
MRCASACYSAVRYTASPNLTLSSSQQAAPHMALSLTQNTRIQYSLSNLRHRREPPIHTIPLLLVPPSHISLLLSHLTSTLGVFGSLEPTLDWSSGLVLDWNTSHLHKLTSLSLQVSVKGITCAPCADLQNCL